MEEKLEATEVKIEDLTKEELVRVLNDKQIESEHYKNEIDRIVKANQDMVKQYNKDMTYMSELNGNLVSAFRKKEDAVKAIIAGALELLTIDRETIAPERKENE
jgi:cupin superfamily acireductone dioxygenase involved in methionine salvage